ncbi:MAG: hypothetical protein U9P71_04340 [Campylobacterota bacterium]|nr:hypothetical protein [Campylobacterota bacterium]
MRQLVTLWGNVDVEILEITGMKDIYLEDEDIIQGDLIFKNNRSHYSHLSLYVPVGVSSNIFHKVKNRSSDIGEFFEHSLRALSDSIIYLYNRHHSKSYICRYYTNIPVFVSKGICKESVYKIKFKVFNAIETIYFDINESNVFSIKSRSNND